MFFFLDSTWDVCQKAFVVRREAYELTPCAASGFSFKPLTVTRRLEMRRRGRGHVAFSRRTEASSAGRSCTQNADPFESIPKNVYKTVYCNAKLQHSKNGLNHPMQTSVHPPFVSLPSGVSWYQRTAAAAAASIASRPCLAKEPKLSRCDLHDSVLTSLSLRVHKESLMYQGVFPFFWNVFLCLIILFVDQWPFSVALLQFGVYLSLILAIKSFAFETQTWCLLALSVSSDWITALILCHVWM